MVWVMTRGFPNLPTIKRAVRELYRVFSYEVLRTFRSGYYATRQERPSGDAVIATQDIARRIAGLYRLQIGTVIVSFVSHLNRPGQIELSDSNDFFIELHSEYRYQYKQVAAILAHEIAHIVCHRLKISIGNKFENEVLTDTTAAYLGAGVPILNAFTEERDFTGTGEASIQLRQVCFGYTTPDEFGYLLAKRHAAVGDDPEAFLTSKPGIDAYKIGVDRARQDLSSAPLMSAGIRARASYRLRRYVASRRKLSGQKKPPVETVGAQAYQFEIAEECSVLFDCPTCFQRLRLPTGHDRIAVRCPSCHERFACATWRDPRRILWL